MNSIKAQVAKVKLNKSSITIYVGDSTNLKVPGTSKGIKWSIFRKTIAPIFAAGKIWNYDHHGKSR